MKNWLAYLLSATLLVWCWSPAAHAGAKKAEAPARAPYKLGPNDLDWRGTGKSFKQALDEAFHRTGVPEKAFHVTKWGKDKHGKSAAVEWKAAGGAEVSVDWPHAKNGPDVPHVGWQMPGKGPKAKVGHILLDSVPYNR